MHRCVKISCVVQKPLLVEKALSDAKLWEVSLV